MQVEASEFTRENLSTMRSLESVLANASVESVLQLPRNSVVVIPTGATVKDALEILSTNNITSAPLYDFVNNNYYGFLDLQDILRFLIRCFINDSNREISDDEWRSIGSQLTNLQYRGVYFENCNVMIVKGLEMGTSTPIPPPIHFKAPLPTLLSRLAAYPHCVVNISANQSTITSQSDVIKFLASNITSYTPQVRYGTVSSDIASNRPIAICNPDTIVIQAFYRIFKQGTPCAVVDKNGRLAANLSLSDLKGLNLQNFPALMGSVSDYILGAMRVKAKFPPVSVRSDTTFEQCLLVMTATRVHHLWVVDNDNRPLSVLTTNDIIWAAGRSVWNFLGGSVPM